MRILLVELPKMLSDIVAEIVSAEPDMSVVGAVSHARNLVGAALAKDADFVLLGSDGPELPDSCRELLEVNPAAKVLVVAHEGRQAFLYRLEPQLTSVGELGAETLLSSIRAASRPRTRPPRRQLSTRTSEDQT